MTTPPTEPRYQKPDERPLGEIHVFTHEGTRKLDYVSYATSLKELKTILEHTTEHDYFHLHVYFGDALVGNGDYALMNALLSYKEYGACRGLYTCFASRYLSTVDELA